MRAPTAGVRVVGVAVAALILGAFLVGGLTRVSINTDVETLLPQSDPAVGQLNDQARSFGGDPVVVLLESAQPHRLLAQDQLPSLLKLEGDLSRLPDVATVYGPATVLNQIAGRTQDLLAELTGRRAAIRAAAVDQARKRGAANPEAAGDQALAGFDARYGSLLAQGLPAGLPTLHNQSFVNTVVYTPTGTPRPQWRFVLPTDMSAAILIRPRQGLDEAATERLLTNVHHTVDTTKLATSRVTVSGAPAVIGLLGQEVRTDIVKVGGAAIVAVSLCFLLVPWTRRWRRVVPVATTLVASGLVLAAFGWAGHPLSLGVVSFLPVLLGVGSYYPTYFVQHARRRTIVVVAMGTALSFATLAMSPLTFVRDLGLTLALGVSAACAVGFLLLLGDWRGRGSPAVADDSRALHADGQPATPRRVRWTVACAVAGVALTGWATLPSLPVQADLNSIAAGLPAAADVQHVEQVLGSSGELDIVLRGGDVTTPAALAWMSQAQDAVITQFGDQLHPVVSPPTLLGFLGAAPTPDQIQAGLRLVPADLTGSVLRDDHRVASMTFGVSPDDAQRLQALRDAIHRALPPAPPGYDVEMTGLPLVATRAYELVSTSRYLANFAGICTAGLVLAIGLTRRRDAGRAVLAAVTSTGLGLFAIWLLGVPLNPLTVALGSLTAAVGCEFTVMLAEADRRGSRLLRRTVWLAGASSAAGYGVLFFSDLGLIRTFGALLACSVLLSVLAAHLVLWTLPPGRQSAGARTEATRTSESTSPVGAS